MILENKSLVKIGESDASQIEINQNDNCPKVRLEKESEIILSLNSSSIVKIYYNMIKENLITIENHSLVKIKQNPTPQIEINQNYSHVELKLNGESETILKFASPSIIKIYCDITLSPNTWAKLLQFNTWQEVLDRYDTWKDLLNDTSIL